MPQSAVHGVQNALAVAADNAWMVFLGGVLILAVATLAGYLGAKSREKAVETMVKNKIEGGEVKRTPVSTKSSGEVVDLLAALQRSVEAAKTARGESTPAAEEKPKKKAAKKSPAKKAKKESK